MSNKRHTYKGELAKPLRSGQKPEDKLALLLTDLGVTSAYDALIAMLDRHVIGHNVRDFPRSLRGAPKKGPSAEQRLPELLKYLGVTDSDAALLMMVVRFVPGFRPPSPQEHNGGPPGNVRGANREFSRIDAHAEEDWVCENLEGLLSLYPELTRLEAAELVVTNSLVKRTKSVVRNGSVENTVTYERLGLSAEQIVEKCKPSKYRRDQVRAERETRRMYTQLRELYRKWQLRSKKS